MSTPYKVGPLRDHASAHGDPEMGHSTDGGYVYGITTSTYAECERYGCPVVVVIDPEDRAQVERLADAFVEKHETGRANTASEHTAASMQAALRELADPKPPKPEVYAHVAIARAPGTIHEALCGKVWTPEPNVTVVGDCPNCRDLVEGEWTP